MSAPREDDPDPLRQASDMLPLWRRLVARVGYRNARVSLGTDEPPITLDRFELRRFVGEGSMGAVFEAFDPELGRRVALKVCKPRSEDTTREIEHEARCLAKLSHPNIIAVHEIVRFGADVVLVMEFVDGQTLRDWQTNTKPGWREVLDRYVDAGRALAAVHAAGLEHGDFKPDNVLIDHAGRVRVVDFGIARYPLESSDANEAGEHLGTRPYMPPERLMEKPGGPLADVFAFCVSVWESLYGVRPYSGRTIPALLESIEAGTLERGKVAELIVPDALRAVLARGLRAQASERPQSMEELLRALDDAREGARRRRVRWGQRVGGGLLATLAVASVIMAGMLIREPEPSVVELSAVEQTLMLAEDEARDGDPDAAVQLLEAARSIASRESQGDALRQVAEEATRTGERLAEQGHKDPATASWAVAAGIYIEMGDQIALDRLYQTIKNATHDDLGSNRQNR